MFWKIGQINKIKHSNKWIRKWNNFVIVCLPTTLLYNKVHRKKKLFQIEIYHFVVWSETSFYSSLNWTMLANPYKSAISLKYCIIDSMMCSLPTSRNKVKNIHECTTKKGRLFTAAQREENDEDRLTVLQGPCHM